MKIIIDINEHLYKTIKTLGLVVEDEDAVVVSEAIRKGVPLPKKGHWIIIDDCERFIAKCSECGRIEDSRMINKYPYCHCGANMEVGCR